MLNEIKQGKFWDEFYDKAAEKEIPFKASFELTYQCNLQCRHCYIPRRQRIRLSEDQIIRGSEELCYSEVCSILDQLSDLGCFHLNLTGGEPLTRPDIFQILDYAKRKGFYTILLTNGTLITTEVANRLKDLDINQVDISLYGMRQLTYESITGGPGSFDRCLGGIRLLKERDIPIYLKMTVMTLNIGEFSQVKAFAKKLKVPFRYGYFINPKIDGSKAPLAFRLSPKEGIELERRNQSYLFEEEKRSKKEKETSSKRDGLFYCNAGRNSLAINPYGELNLCLEYHFPGYNLRKGSLSEGWKELVNYVKSAKPGKNYECGNCKLQEFCQWCPAEGWLEKGDRSACVPYFKELAKLRREKMKNG